jgi:hypothetical protein
MSVTTIMHFDAEIVSDLACKKAFSQCHFDVPDSLSTSCFHFLFVFLFYFLNYENAITRLQETWKIQNKATYAATIYYNCLFQVEKLRFLYQTLRN